MSEQTYESRISSISLSSSVSFNVSERVPDMENVGTSGTNSLFDPDGPATDTSSFGGAKDRKISCRDSNACCSIGCVASLMLPDLVNGP